MAFIIYYHEVMSHPVVVSDSWLEWASLGVIISGFAMIYRHFECHENGCHRPGKFPHGHLRACHIHHPLVTDDHKKDIELVTESLK